MQGIPLVASSPVRHGETSPGGGVGSAGGGGGVGGGGGINPVEVHAYAPPWKALTEFALHNDLERIDPSAPHFQQLINQVPYDVVCTVRHVLYWKINSQTFKWIRPNLWKNNNKGSENRFLFPVLLKRSRSDFIVYVIIIHPSDQLSRVGTLLYI